MDRASDDAARLRALDRPCGSRSAVLRTGFATVRLEGLSDAQAGVLTRRWGPFLDLAARAASGPLVRFYDAGTPSWLPPWSWGERYRIVGSLEDRRVLVRSYYFAIAEDGRASWRVAVCSNEAEPVGRTLDNAMRWVVARLAVDAGGIALHGAGVLRGGGAHVFAGPSGSGKTTAVRLSFPGASLGDDLAVLIPAAGGWTTAALPFDNTEAVTAEPPEGRHPVAGVWRLYKSPSHRLERPTGPTAASSLTSCVASAWAMPDREREMAAAVDAIIGASLFGHLHFAPDPGFWALLEP